MKATLSQNRQAITLENGTVFNTETEETVADFMSRVRKVVKEEYLEDLKIEKALSSPELDAIKKDLIEQSDANRRAKAAAAKPKMTEEEKAAAKEAAAKAKEEAAKAKAEAKAKMEEAKAATKEEAAKAKAEAKAKAQAEKEEALKAELESRKAELEAKAAEMVQEAEVKASEMIAIATEKATAYIEKVKLSAQKLIETGKMTEEKGERAPRVSTGIRVEPDQIQVNYIDSIVGENVQFTKGAETISGKITARSIDYRVGIVFARIVSDKGLTYHKSFNKIGELTLLGANTTEAIETVE